MKSLKLLFYSFVVALGIVPKSFSACDPTLQPTHTPNVGLSKPAINSCGWGNAINANWSIIDSSFAVILGTSSVLNSTNTFTGTNTFSNPLILSYLSSLNMTSSAGTSYKSIFTGNGLGSQDIEIQVPNGIGLGINNSNGLGGIPAPYVLVGSPGGVWGNYGSFGVSGSSANATATYSGFTSTNNVNQSTIWALPKSDGSNGQALVTDGSSHLSFGNISGTTGGIVSPATFTWTNNFGIVLSTAEFGSSSSILGPDGTSSFHGAYVNIRSSGTSQGLLIDSRGIVAGGGQRQAGALTIRNDANPGSPASTLAVLVDSTTDAQTGTGEFEIWSENPNHNDPIFWIHRISSNSSPEMRWDSPSPNMEMVCTSTDNAHGRGKWEPYATPAGGEILQVNSRAWDNTTFENVAYWEPLSIQPSVGLPGLYLRAQDLANDSGILTSSAPSAVNFFTLNNHTVGLQGPANTTASWAFQIPNTYLNANQILYQTTNSNPWNWAFTPNISIWTSSATAPASGGFGVTYGLTVGSMTINGSGAGTITATEGSVPSGTASSDVMWADSTDHHWKTIDNNTSTATLVTSSSPITAGQCVGWSASGQVISVGCGILTNSTQTLTGANTIGYNNQLYFQTSNGVNGASIYNNVGLGAKALTIGAADGLGIGTNNPNTGGAIELFVSGGVQIAGSTSTAYELTTATTSSPSTLFHVAVSTSGHFITNGTAPTISSCGSGPSGSVVGNDNEGIITVGGGAVTACTLTFAKTWGTTPVCTISDNSTAITGDISTLNSTTLITSFSASLGGGTIYYKCGCSGSSCL